jgi:hypothetical protein
MLSPRLTNCIECASITALLADIDCKMAEIANNLYNNVVFSLNRPISGVVTNDLLNYKRILTYKLSNIDYAADYTVAMIASKVKILIHK